MRLRTELLLLFGLMTILMGGVVYYSQYATRQILMAQVEDDLSAPAFPDLLSQRTFVLRTIGAVTGANPFLGLTRTHLVSGAMDLLRKGRKHEEIMTTLYTAKDDDGKKWTSGDFYGPVIGSADSIEKVHPKDENEAWAVAWISLRTLTGDSLLTPFNLGNTETERNNPLDLLILTDALGRVLVEQRSGPDGAMPGSDPQQPQLSSPTRALLERANNGELFKPEFLVHGDKQLYLSTVVPAGGDTGNVGLLLLGTRIDSRFLDEAKKVAGSGVFAVAVVHGQVDQPFIVGSVDAPADLNNDLLAQWGELGHAEGARQVRLGARRYLITVRPLGNVGSVVFLKTLTGIERQLDEQTAGIVSVGVAILAFCFVAVLGTTRRITRPIEELAAKMVLVGHGDLSPEARSGGTWEVAQAAESFNQMVTGLRQKEEAMKFLPQQTREEIEAHTGEVQLGGQRIKATILFSDLRGFTSLSEKLPPQEVVELLNEYLNRMTEVVLRHGGDVNEFIGDAILAVFRSPKGAEQAVDAALAMNAELAELQKITTNQHLKEMRQGIGINTGELVAGNIGTAERKKGAVVGDTVNLAARIQDRSRNGKHTCILVSDDTRQDLPHRLKTELFGDEEFKGKSQPVRVWEVLG